MTVPHLLPGNASRFERTLALANNNAARLDVDLRILADPWACPEAFLPWLARTRGVDIWDSDWPVSKKRQVVSEAHEHWARRGSEHTIRRYLEYAGAEIAWFANPGRKFYLGHARSDDPHRFRADLPELVVERALPVTHHVKAGRLAEVSEEPQHPFRSFLTGRGNGFLLITHVPGQFVATLRDPTRNDARAVYLKRTLRQDDTELWRFALPFSRPRAVRRVYLSGRLHGGYLAGDLPMALQVIVDPMASSRTIADVRRPAKRIKPILRDTSVSRGLWRLDRRTPAKRFIIGKRVPEQRVIKAYVHSYGRSHALSFLGVSVIADPAYTAKVMVRVASEYKRGFYIGPCSYLGSARLFPPPPDLRARLAPAIEEARAAGTGVRLLFPPATPRRPIAKLNRLFAR